MTRRVTKKYVCSHWNKLDKSSPSFALSFHSARSSTSLNLHIFTSMQYSLLALAFLASVNAAPAPQATVTTITSTISATPDYFQTSETNTFFANPTATAAEPFLAETNPAPFPSESYIPPSPLEVRSQWTEPFTYTRHWLTSI